MLKITSMSLCAMIAVAGCAASNEYDAEPDPVRDPHSAGIGMPPDPGAEAGPTLGVPTAVRNAFRRDFPQGQITSIRRLDASTGVLLYEINFLLNRQPEDVIYRADGTPITRTPLKDAPPADGAGRRPSNDK